MISGAIFEVALFTQPESLRACALAEVAAVIGGVLRGFRWLQVTGSLKNRRSRSFDFAETAGQTHFCRLTAQSCVLSDAPPDFGRNGIGPRDGDAGDDNLAGEPGGDRTFPGTCDGDGAVFIDGGHSQNFAPAAAAAALPSRQKPMGEAGSA